MFGSPRWKGDHPVASIATRVAKTGLQLEEERSTVTLEHRGRVGPLREHARRKERFGGTGVQAML